MNHRLAPWQVWWTDFDPHVGREQAGRRPAIVVGTALSGSLPNNLAIVVPMTSTNRGLPFQPPIVLGDRTGYAMVDQIKSVSLDRLLSRHRAALGPEDIDTLKFTLRQIINVA